MAGTPLADPEVMALTAQVRQYPQTSFSKYPYGPHAFTLKIQMPFNLISGVR